MSKAILAVFGATGNQGFSVASHVLSTPSLSSRYTVRALSRNPSHPSMAMLASQGAQLAQADLDDASTLAAALQDVSYLFLNTPTPRPQDGSTARAVEARQVKSVCRAALAAGVRYIVFSSMSHPLYMTHGALQRVAHFDVKAESELYIRRLPIQSAFIAPASFMQNYTTMMKPQPARDQEGTYVLANMLPGHVRVPYIDVTDTGKWVGAVLAEPDKYSGKFFAAAEAFYTPNQVAEIMTKVTGKTVRHVQLPDHVVKGFFPENVSDQMFEMFALFRDYGYYGEDQEELVKWARDQVHGQQVTDLEAFLRRIDYKLE